MAAHARGDPRPRRSGWPGPVGEGDARPPPTALVADLADAGAPSRRRGRRWPARSRAAPTRWPSWSWPSRPAARSPRSTSTTGCAPGSAAEADVVADAAAPVRGRASRAARVSVAPGPNLEARARAARFAVLPAGVATGHTMDDQAETILVQPAAGRRAPTGWRAWSPGPRHPLLGLRRRETHALCARGRARSRSCDPSNDDPAFVRNRVRHELLPLCAEVAGRDPVPAAGPAGRRAARRGGAARRAGRRARCPTRPTPGRVARRRRPLARRALRRWLRDEAGDGDHPPSLAEVERTLAVAAGDARRGPSSRAAGGCAARPAGSGSSRSAPVVSRR